MSWSELLRPELAQLDGYHPSAGTFEVRLDANEAIDFWSAEARQRFSRATQQAPLGRYPDPTAAALRGALCAYLGCDPDALLLGAGSDEVIALLLTSLGNPRRKQAPPVVMLPTPTFVMYAASARVRGFQVVEIPLDSAWQLDRSAFLQAIERFQPNLIFLASPNNPTAASFREEDLRTLVEHAPHSLVVLDEAYAPYAGGSRGAWVKEHSNVAVLGTLSKVGLAALRVGWALAAVDLVRQLDKARQPYNIPLLSQQLATIALREFSHEMAENIARTLQERAWLAAKLSAHAAIERVEPSDANFLWLRTRAPAVEVFQRLKERSILVRAFHGREGRLEHMLRISVGHRVEHERLLEALG